MLDAVHKELDEKYRNHPNFIEYKICPKCNTTKHYTDYYIAKRNSPAGYRLEHKCKLCTRKAARDTKWKNKFGVTKEEVFQQYELQKGKCLICESKMTLPKFGVATKDMDVMHIDHCHTTGKFRGLLCHYCNAGLGQFKDNKDLLAKAYKYLDERNS